ncbi:MAG TPA: hypothetical protein VIP79_05020 [Gemmatimonadaceae bacterium]
MSWTIPALLGAYHGLNPAMGWLFAVALGVQHQRASSVLSALPPIALGHAVSVALAVAVFVAGGLFLPVGVLRVGAAAMLFAFGIWLVVRRRAHPRWVGMRLGFRDLTIWSFLMSTAHGAGLMLLPVLVGGAAAHADMQHHAQHTLQGGSMALVAHTGAMFLVMGVVALVVYRVLGVGFLRKAWFNFDIVWTAAIFLAAASTLVV